MEPSMQTCGLSIHASKCSSASPLHSYPLEMTLPLLYCTHYSDIRKDLHEKQMSLLHTTEQTHL